MTPLDEYGEREEDKTVELGAGEQTTVEGEVKNIEVPEEPRRPFYKKALDLFKRVKVTVKASDDARGDFIVTPLDEKNKETVVLKAGESYTKETTL